MQAQACGISLLSDTQPLSLYINTQDGYEKEQQTQTDAIWVWIFCSSCSNKKMPIRWKRRRERGGEWSIIHLKQRDIEREDGGARGRSDDVWLWALGSIVCDTSNVRRLRQTTVRAHVILTQDAGRADYWTSPVSLLWLSFTHTSKRNH